MNWRIYYMDGTTYDNTQGTWDDAPLDGVVCVVTRSEDGFNRYVLNGLNYYYMPANPLPTDATHTNDAGPQLRARCPWLKHGVGLSRSAYMHILQRACKDKDFPDPVHPMRRSTDK